MASGLIPGPALRLAARGGPGGPRLSPAALLRDGLDWSGRTDRAALAAVALLTGALWAGPRILPPNAGWARPVEVASTVAFALLVVPAAGHVLRRLHDAGARGAWAWLLLLPGARLALVAVLLALPPSQRRRAGDGRGHVLGQAVAGMAALVVLAGLGWTTAPVLAQGMKPALWPGDLVLLRRAPLDLARGEVVAFRLDGEAAPRVARVVALPGDRVAVEDGRPVIDGTPATRAEDGWLAETFAPEGPGGSLPLCGNGAVGLGAPCATRRLLETLPGGPTYAVLDAGLRERDERAGLRVPEGRVFVLGDHRDAAADSRLPRAAQGTGLVPLDAVLGRVDRVLASSAAVHPWDPRGWRLGRLLLPIR